MAFTAHQLAKMILSRPDVTLDQAQGQGLGHKEPVVIEDGCRIWLKFYPPAHGKTAQAKTTPVAPPPPAIAPRVKRAKPEAAGATVVPQAAPATPKAAPAQAAPAEDRMAALEAKLEALMNALGGK